MNRQSIIEGIKEFKVRKATQSKLAKAGLFTPVKPADVVNGTDLFAEWERMKQNFGGIANIPFYELGEYLDRWTQMIAYARWVEAVADIDQATAREIRDTVRKQLYTIQEGGREMKDAAVCIEPTYLELEKQYMETFAMYTAVKALREGYEQRANAISREITRRSNDLVDSRRAINRGQTA